MKKLIIFKLCILQLSLINQSQAFFGYFEKEMKPVAVIVNSELYPQIKESIDRYLEDLKNEGYEVIFSKWDTKEHPDVEELREILKEYYKSSNIQGAVLIGDIPYACCNFENEDDEDEVESPHVIDHTGPFESYLMALFTDFQKDKNNIIISSNDMFDLNIWVSRICAQDSELLFNNKSEAELINKYFYKNHLYRICRSPTSNLKINYFANDELVNKFVAYIIYIEALKSLFNYKSQTGTKEEYLDFIKNNEAQYLMLRSHSKQVGHEFKFIENEEEYLASCDIANTTIRQPFVVLHACSASDFTHPHALGKAYLFGPNSSVLVIAGLSNEGSLPLESLHSNGNAFGANVLNLLSEDYFALLVEPLSHFIVLPLILCKTNMLDPSSIMKAGIAYGILKGALSSLGGLMAYLLSHQTGFTLLGDPTLKPYVDMEWCEKE